MAISCEIQDRNIQDGTVAAVDTKSGLQESKQYNTGDGEVFCQECPKRKQ